MTDGKFNPVLLTALVQMLQCHLLTRLLVPFFSYACPAVSSTTRYKCSVACKKTNKTKQHEMHMQQYVTTEVFFFFRLQY